MDSTPLTLENRVSNLERQMTGIISDVANVKKDTEIIRSVIVGTSRISAFTKKHGPRAIAFILGCLMASGYLTPESFGHWKDAFSVLTN